MTKQSPALEVVIGFERDAEYHKAYQRWRSRCKQRAKQRLVEKYRDEYERLELEERLRAWEERPRSRNMTT